MMLMWHVAKLDLVQVIKQQQEYAELISVNLDLLFLQHQHSWLMLHLVKALVAFG